MSQVEFIEDILGGNTDDHRLLSAYDNLTMKQFSWAFWPPMGRLSVPLDVAVCLVSLDYRAGLVLCARVLVL